MFAMSGDGTDNVDIPVVFLFSQDAWRLLQALAQNPVMLVTLGDTLTGKISWNCFIHTLWYNDKSWYIVTVVSIEG